MNKKHTKGPWEMLHEKDGDIWVFGNQKGRSAICRFLPPKNKYIHGETIETIDLIEENIANAKLIAAAPDLLEAAEQVVAAYGCECLDEGPKNHCPMCALQQAIRKAGE